MTNLSGPRGASPLDGDSLMAQLSAIDPIRDQERTVDVANILRRVTRERRPVTLRSFRLRVAAALVGTASLVGAGIAALTASTSLPIISLASPSGQAVVSIPQPVAFTAPLGITFWSTRAPGIEYNAPMIFSASSSLSTPSSGPAFALSIPDRASEAARLAGVFGIAASPSDAGDSILYRSAAGPEMFYSPASWAPYFLYLRNSNGPDYAFLGGSPHPTSSIGAMGNETADRRNAMSLIASLGLSYQFGSPVPLYGEGTSSATGVTTAFVTFNYPVLVGGVRTDQAVRLTYSRSGDLLEAEAPLFSVAANYTYPLISAATAAAAMTSAEAARQSSDATTSSLPSAGPGAPAVHLTLDHTNVGLMTYRDTSGVFWLLPTFWFTTSATLPDGSIAHGVYAWLAVSRQYVSPGVGPESVP